MPARAAAAADLDLRLAVPAAAAWLAVAYSVGRPPGWGLCAAAGAATVGCALLLVGRGPVTAATAATCWCMAAGLASAALHLQMARPAELTGLASAGATARVDLVVSSDPMPVLTRRRGPTRPAVRIEARMTELEARGRRSRLRAPVLVLATQEQWGKVRAGQRVRAVVRLAPAAAEDLRGALVLPRAPPTAVSPARGVPRWAGSVRSGLRRAVAPLPTGPAALLPGLVIGDTARLSPEVVAEFRTTGLSHLVAVSGANLAIVLGTLVAVSRRLGVRRRLGGVLAGAGVLAFVAVAGPSASVLRAAVMGAVVLVGTQAGRATAAVPALAAATLGLVVADPAMARSAGFTLSVCATAGIVLLAVPVRQRLPGWLPPWAAEAVAVPVAAQVACAPVLVALFGQLSVLAVPANVLAAPAVPVATVVGAAVALLGVVVPPAATALAWLAVPPTAWLLAVAHTGAALPAAAVAWPDGTAGAVLLLAAGLAAGLLLRRRRWRSLVAIGVAAALSAAAALTQVAPAWPPPGWVLTACDVGQGDALALRAGPHAAVVVDAGPDPEAVDRCLRQLGVREVPLVVLTHLHADHVEGLPGVLRHRRVGGVQVGPLAQPAEENARVRRWAAAAGVPVLPVVAGEQRTVGAVHWQVLAPTRVFAGTDSDPNNSSLVLRVRLGGLTALLTGDIELEAQRALLGSGVDLTADVLKVPHHGSGRQQPELFDRVRDRLALISVGAGNDYGHPAATTLARLARARAYVFRTDRDGSVAVVRRGGAVVAVGRRGSGRAAAAGVVPPPSGSPPAGPRDAAAVHRSAVPPPAPSAAASAGHAGAGGAMPEPSRLTGARAGDETRALLDRGGPSAAAAVGPYRPVGAGTGVGSGAGGRVRARAPPAVRAAPPAVATGMLTAWPTHRLR